MRKHTTSYWGPVQYETVLCPGIHVVGTAGHGGVVVDAEHLAAMPEKWRETPYSPEQWFEEDSDWVLPFVWFESEILAGGDADAVRTIKSGQHIKELERGHRACYAEYLASKVKPARVDAACRDLDRYQSVEAQKRALHLYHENLRNVNRAR